MSQHNITGSEAFAPPPYAGMVRAYRRPSAFARAVIPSLIGGLAFFAIAACCAALLA